MSSSTKSKNFRRRGDDSSDDPEPPGPPTSASVPGNNRPPASFPSSSFSSSSSSSSSKPKSKPKKLLSFADDEDGDSAAPLPSRVSKSSSTPVASRLGASAHKLTAAKDRLPPKPSATTTPSNVQPQAGTYTKEALLELQKNTRTLAKPTSSKAKTSSSSAAASPSPPEQPPQIILKGLLKPQTTSTIRHAHHDEDGHSRSQELLQGAEFHDDDDNDDSTRIYDEDTIRRIRAEKERLRHSRAAAPDYISLDTGVNHGAAAGGLSDEEPEIRTRIAMIGHMKKGSTGTHGVFEDVGNGIDSDDDYRVKVKAILAGKTSKYVHNPSGIAAAEEDNEDEEDKIWEEEQFRKALGKRMDDSSGTTGVLTTVATTTTANQQQQQQHKSSVTYGSVPSIGGALGASQGLDALSIPQQAEVARKALQDNVRRLKESHGKTISLLSKTDENLSASLLNITALEKSLTAAGEKFIFMQKLRDFVSVICEFLQHKAPFIEELEEQMKKLHEQRALAIVERRTGDNDDEMMEVEAAVKAATMVFGEHDGSRRDIEKLIPTAANAAQAALAAIKEQANLPVKLDEFGRDINQQKRMDMKRRADARKRRKARFDTKRLSLMEVDGSEEKVEGESSTDESDSESAAYQSNCDLLLQTADQIFSDASEEYSQILVVKERLEGWKKKYLSTYRDAYMSLGAPAIFSPYVRLELLKWNPLHEDADFFDMKWHSLLFNYGLPEDKSDLNPDDADSNLVPELVERVAIPILHHDIECCWDMLSTRETRNAVSATSLVTNYVPASSEALAGLLSAIHNRLADAVSNIMVPTWSPLVLKAVPNAARVAAYRFGMSVRLMRNICLWKDILALSVLEKLALDELLCGKVLPHIQIIASNVHDAVTKTERIIASLSGVWAGPSVRGDCSRKLQPLAVYLLSLGRILSRKHASGLSETETSVLARRLKKMLVELNDYDNAREIAKTFNLKEAL